jgi:hypothetical protein
VHSPSDRRFEKPLPSTNVNDFDGRPGVLFGT